LGGFWCLKKGCFRLENLNSDFFSYKINYFYLPTSAGAANAMAANGSAMAANWQQMAAEWQKIGSRWLGRGSKWHGIGS
jgi:hypothetical protein